MKIQKRIREDEKLPRFYGVAWYDLRTQQAVCYPAPLNWLVLGLYRLYWGIRLPPAKLTVTARDKRVFEAGVQHGEQVSEAYIDGRVAISSHAARKQGYQEGWHAHEQHVDEHLEQWTRERREAAH